MPHDDPTGAFAAPWHAPDDETRALQRLHDDTETYRQYAATPPTGTREYDPPPTGRRARDLNRPGTPVPGFDPPPARPGRTAYGEPTYNAPATGGPGPAPARPRGVAGAARGVGGAAKFVTRKVITASEADGAKESGLTALIWNQVLSYGTDAMITVALAGTVFFGASSNAQRGNVLLYLLVTMAPFAVVAPFIGPALDRLQHGRRWTMAGTAAGRAVLALVMAGHPTDLLVLYPCALGSLVLSKAYGVVRAAAAPRLVPRGMTLTEANARLTIFGLVSTLVLGGFVGAIIKVSGSYGAGLCVTAVGFAACAFFAARLPKQVDSAAAAPRHPDEPVRPTRQDTVPPLTRISSWARRGFDPHIVIALQGESVLRLLSGMFTIYLAFYVESTQHGFAGVLELGGVVGAAGAGNFIGTAIGTRLKPPKPELVIIVSVCISAVVCLVGALTFTILVAIAVLLVSAVANALSKISLDSLIQNDVVETLRSSAFARSETFLQLAWVVGAALAVVLPSHGTGDGLIAFLVAAAVTVVVAAVIVLRTRAEGRAHHGVPAAATAQYRSVD
ncbi:MAG: MFS transporter [Jatrophihabitans endophyticus]|nr:MFS transporter [Jatrophihabitans endophyticus]